MNLSWGFIFIILLSILSGYCQLEYLQLKPINNRINSVNPDYAIANPPRGVVKDNWANPGANPAHAIVKPPQGVVTPAPISRPERSVVIRPTRSVLRISQ
jgi:hypothetical protein